MKEEMQTRPIHIIWKGKKLLCVYGLSVESVEQKILVEMGVDKLPPKTVIFEPMRF